LLAALVPGLVAVLAAVPAPQVRCAVDDARIDELSGMAVHDGALWAVTDGGRRVQVHRLDGESCAVTDTRTADVDPYDVEDLAVGPDGAFWVADIGDNDRDRATIAVVVLPERGAPRMHRLTYPDGPHDAEALLVDGRGRPVVITKEIGRAGVYRTAEPPDGRGPTALVRIGDLTLPTSDTEGGPVGGVGSRVVTGAAMSADGAVVALRSYTDAWLYPVADGDLVGALSRAPMRVPLPGEPQGEAIAFDSDGALLSGSETRGGVHGEIRVVPGAAALVGTEEPTVAGPADEVGHVGSPSWLPAAIGGGAVVGVLLLGMAAVALRAARRGR
jgi:hypothetical protein